MKVVILTHFSPASEYFCRGIELQHELAGVFIEKSTGSKFRKAFRQFKRNRRKRGLFNALARFFELPFVMWLEASYYSRQRKFFTPIESKGDFHDVVHVVESVNDPETVESVRALGPDAICVFGSSILKSPIIRVPRLGALNMHNGILPEYRGAKSEFWALAEGDFENVGVTVHLVDEGLDTGAIVGLRRVPVEPGDDDRTLRCKTVVAGTDVMLQVLAELEKGVHKPIFQEKKGARLFSTPTFPAWLRMRRNLRLLKNR